MCELYIRLTSSQVESALSLVQEREDSQSRVNSTTEPLKVPDANLILRSSDLVDFRVHKSVLAMASPIFTDLLSLPQPSDSESADGVPVVQISEDAELLAILISILYPVRPVIPSSYEKVLYLLAACQKYDMVQAQSFIRAEVNRGDFPAPVGTEVFSAYAIASAKRLIPEAKSAARFSLDYPMTFETLGEGLRLFEGSALTDLVHFRKRCQGNLVTCLESFLEANAPGPSSIWVGCPDAIPKRNPLETPPPQGTRAPSLPSWLCQVLSRSDNDLFTNSLTTSSNIRGEYLVAIQTHTDCAFCLRVHTTKGSTFCAELESKLAEARDKVQVSFF
jgi:BTB/POZ domain